MDSHNDPKELKITALSTKPAGLAMPSLHRRTMETFARVAAML